MNFRFKAFFIIQTKTSFLENKKHLLLQKRIYTLMKFFLQFFIFTIILNLNLACQQNQEGKPPLDAQKTDDGLNYQFFIKNEKGQKANIGDYITYHLVIENHKNKVIQSTYNNIQGAIIDHKIQKPRFKGGNIDEMLLLMAAGDSAVFWVNIDTLIAKTGQNYPIHAEKGSNLKYTFKVLEVRTQSEINKSIQKNMTSQYQKDKKLIKEYLSQNLDKNKLAKVKQTNSGIHYFFQKESNGKLPKKGDTAYINYKGKLLDGTVFESSEIQEPLKSPIGQNLFFSGWDEGIMLFPEGSKATMLLPSQLAYGTEGVESVVPVPANSVVIFEVELLKVK